VISVSNSNDNLHLVQVTSAKLNGQMLVISDMEIWRTVLLWMFLLSLLFFLILYFFISLHSGPVYMVLAQVLTNSGDMSSGDGVSICARSAEWLLYLTDWLLDWCICMFVYVAWLFHCFHSFLLFYGCIQPRGSAPKEGDDVMAWLHVTCQVPGNIAFI